MMDKVLPHALPCLLILTLSIVIMVGLRRAKMETAAITGEVRDRRSLVSLLLISLLYIVSTVPYVSVWGFFNHVIYRDVTSYTPQRIEIVFTAGMFTTSISMMNYSFNFLIYSFTLKIYKEELKSIFLLMCSPSKGHIKDISS
jgi:Flp pilus assembly protein protease CpaA